MASLGTTFPFKDSKPLIQEVSILQEGQILSIKFDVVDDVTKDGGRAFFEFHFSPSWLHSSSPLLCGSEYYRRSPSYFSKVCSTSKVVHANVVKNGVTIRFEAIPTRGGSIRVFQDTYPPWFLFAYAPYTGILISSSPESVSASVDAAQSDPMADVVSNAPDISLISYLAQYLQKPWSKYPPGHEENVLGHEHLKSVPTYDAESVRKDPALLHQLTRDVAVHPGIVAVYNVQPPEAYDEETLANDHYQWFLEFFGKPNQHPVRNSQVFQMCQEMDAPTKEVSQDYDLSYGLSMHTDSVLYASSHSFLQANYHTICDGSTRITDGFACADYLKERYPEYYKILSTTPVTYGIRHQLYTRDGAHSTDKKNQVDIRAKMEDDDFHEFELVNSRPVISVKKGYRQIRDKDGSLRVEETELPVQVIHSPVKVGVSAIDMPLFDKYMEANEKWYDIIEGREPGLRGAHLEAVDWPQDSMLIFNNHRVLHGRGTIVNAGIQKHVRRPVDYGELEKCDGSGTTLDHNENKIGNGVTPLQPLNTNAVHTQPEKKPMAQKYRRQMIGAHMHRVNVENRLRYLTMKILEDELSGVEMEVYSELDELKRNGTILNGKDVLACWFPRCPTKILERMMPRPEIK